MKCPLHIVNNVFDASVKFASEADEAHLFYQVKCLCGGIKFRVLKSNKPSVFAICSQCSKKVVVYDVGLYPAATVSVKPYAENIVLGQHSSDTFKVYVMYEYSDLDNDQDFDPNDISWCAVFVEDALGTITKIIDDETA